MTLLNRDTSYDIRFRICLMIILIFGIAIPILFGYNLVLSNKKAEYSANLNKSTNQGVLAWLSAYTSKDYSTCDNLVSESSYKITSFDASNALNTSTVAYKLYISMHDKLSEAIISIDIISVEDIEDCNVYTIKVSYNRYKSCTGVVIDSSALSSICDKFINSNNANDVYLSELERIYSDSFNNTFTKSDNVCSTVIKLSEKEVNGVTYVYSTKEFIDSLLADMNITSNVVLFENNIQKEINKVLIQY